MQGTPARERMASEVGSQRSSTSSAASARPTAGRSRSAAARWTSRHSVALHTPGRWTLPFTAMATASASAALSSRKRWQIPW